MEGAAGHIALAVAAGATAKKDDVAEAVKERLQALKKAIAKKSDAIRFDDVENDPASSEHRDALAKDLDEHGAANDRDVLNVARELLGLIKIDEAARNAVGAMIEDVETALTDLAKVEPVSQSSRSASEGDPRSSAAAVAKSSAAEVTKSSARGLPASDASKTDLERSLLPVWRRTDHFTLKLGLFFATLTVIALTLWIVLRAPPNEALDRCNGGDKGKCWQVVAAEDTVDQGKNVSSEPLERLCKDHKDACACAGLAYVNAVRKEGFADCGELEKVSELDPKWPCTCTRYAFWRRGEQRTMHCGIPRCE